MNRFQTDVAIVGGGMVGATLACLLRDSGLAVTLLEQQPPQSFAPGQPHDLRVSAISPASRRILESAGAWAGIAAMRSCPYRRMRVWEQRAFGDALFDAADAGSDALGWIVENPVTQLALWQVLEREERISLCAPVAIKQIHYAGDGSTLHLDNGDQIHCSLLVGADGARSRVREAMGIGVNAREYRQQALIAYVATTAAQQDMTWQRFLPQGPQALLPLTGPHASLVWYERPQEVKRLLALDGDAFIDELQQRFPPELGEVKALLGRASFPLRRQHALRYAQAGGVVIGDAAHTIHPLAGQGVNIGLLDAAVLAELLCCAQRDGRDIAGQAVLAGYEARRRPHNLLMMSAMELFYRGFGSEQPLLKGVRNLGLALAQHSGPLKQHAVRFAMGLAGDLPDAAKAG
ncbi:UbiH/UbiF/VisC/COQ6 family ubiquinone biosynthesis hydroxylase [Motiliproteus sediminis]|uniref:UbiH/UbiF/VisC/COQ6 family ubiquinone biosynthesis hydroxylase n=1 Tax=Motiliproteus sediminis TaxID=1468178 RepID=UPI001AEF9836